MSASRTTTVLAACILTAVGACKGADGPPPLGALKLVCARPIPSDAKLPCKFEVRDGAGATVYSQYAGVETRAGVAAGFSKKSYGLELRTATGVETSADLLGMGADGDWILDGLGPDRSLMRGALVFDSFRQLGGARYAPEGRYCTLDINGEAQGIYRLVEKIKRDDDRLNIAADDGTGRSFIVRQDSGGRLGLSIGLEEYWEFVYPNSVTATPKQLAGVQDWLDSLAVALGSDNPGDPKSGVFASLDLDATVDWILIEELSKNIDAYNRSIHFVRDGGRPARIVPWEVDLSFGQPIVEGDTSDPKNESPDGWITERPAFIRVLGGIAALKSRIGPRWRALRGGPLSTDAIMSRLDSYGVTLVPSAIARNFEIWSLQAVGDAGSTDAVSMNAGDANAADAPDTDAAILDAADTAAATVDAGDVDATTVDVALADASNPDAAERPNYSFYPVADYTAEVARLRVFIRSRLDWIDAHIDTFPN